MPVEKIRLETKVVYSPDYSFVPKERLEWLTERRESLMRRLLVHRMGCYLLQQNCLGSSHRVTLAAPENSDHGDQHTEAIRASIVDFLTNVPVVETDEHFYKTSGGFIRPIEHSIAFHDLQQALGIKQAHDASGALFYWFASDRFVKSLQEDGEHYAYFQSQEQEARLAMANLIKRGQEIFTKTKDDDNRYWSNIIVHGTENGWGKYTRRWFYFDILNGLNTGIVKTPEWKEIAEYLGYLDNYFLTPLDRFRTATIILNHGNPEKLARDIFSIFDIKTALNLTREDLTNEDLYEKFSLLKTFRQSIEDIEKGLQPDVVIDLDEEERKNLETWTKYFTAEDLYWTVSGGMTSIVRTVVTSAKIYKTVRPLVVMSRKESTQALVKLVDDFEERISLVRPDGHPRGLNDYPDDLSRIMAEANLHFDKLCPNIWFLARIVKSYQTRFDAFDEFVLSVITGDFNHIRSIYEQFRTEDISRLKKRYSGEKLKKMTLLTNSRHAQELENIESVFRKKQEGLKFTKREIMIARKLMGRKGVHNRLEQVIEGIPESERTKTHKRVGDLLKMLKEMLIEKYTKVFKSQPFKDFDQFMAEIEPFLRGMGYISPHADIPYLYVEPVTE